MYTQNNEKDVKMKIGTTISLELSEVGSEERQRKVCRAFNKWVSDKNIDEQSLARKRMSYISLYYSKKLNLSDEVLEVVKFLDEYSVSVREKRIKAVGVSQAEFDNFEILQKAISDLKLNSISTYELFIYFYGELKSLRNTISIVPSHFKYRQVARFMDVNSEKPIKVDVNIGGKHFHLEDDIYLKALINRYLRQPLDTEVMAGGREKYRFTKRQIDYYLIKLLFENLPVKIENKRGKYTQAERNLALSILWLIGSLRHNADDDPTSSCSKENNATFDKLMRDFAGSHLPTIGRKTGVDFMI